MPNIEKVINGLEACKSSDKTCSDCPYNEEVCTTSLCDDVLILLKEQENDIHHMGLIINEYENELKKRQEIVMCKDCKHGRLYAPNCIDCEYMELARDADWFCADGERKLNKR